MTGMIGQPPSLARSLADLSFYATTTRLRPDVGWQNGRVIFLDQCMIDGGALRGAALKWFSVWGADKDRMSRLRCLVLPSVWIGLLEDEKLAVLLSQLRRVNPSVPETPWLSNALWRARSRLRLELMQGD